MNCQCLEKANEALKDRGIEIDSVLNLNFKNKDIGQDMIIPVRNIKSGRRTTKTTIFVTYCPICGKKQSKT
jgi:hypothetical protein